ncbi:MAG TPA: multicopper oxidase domain-containing protein [Mariprofundaceae bacterium]|nr:multicopper oxidase domain-containing protein [Mariprofundaceae bacterium]
MKILRVLYIPLFAVCVWLGAATSAQAAKHEFNMSIDEVEIQVAPDLKYKVFGFDSQVPGPLIHVHQGDDVTVHVTNNTSLPHTIHWHGLYQHNNWQNDGVPGITQEKGIQPGATYTYHWVAEKPGTMWYHCHVNANEHTGIRGMWGPIIVDPDHPTDLEKKVTKDVIMMMSSWESEAAGKYGVGGGPRDARDYFSINGRSFPLTQPLRVKHGDFVRIRFIGAGNTSHAMHSHGHDMLVAFKDGLPIKDPYYVDTLGIIPGSHNDVFINMDNSGRFIFHDHIDTQSTNNGKFPGGVVTVIEYDGNPKDAWYVWKDVNYNPDFFFEQSIKKGYGIFDQPAFRGTRAAKQQRGSRHN